MKPFRRTGLEDDDEIGTRPATLQSRPLGSPQYASRIYFDDESSNAWEEESVVSAMTALSDLESVYNNETPSRYHPTNLRERFLREHSLPNQTRTVSSILSEREREAPQNTISPAPTKTGGDSDSDATMKRGRRDPRQRQPWQAGVYHPGKVFLDPHEKACGCLAMENCRCLVYRDNFHATQLKDHDKPRSLPRKEIRVEQAPPERNMQLPKSRRRRTN